VVAGFAGIEPREVIQEPLLRRKGSLRAGEFWNPALLAGLTKYGSRAGTRDKSTLPGKAIIKLVLRQSVVAGSTRQANVTFFPSTLGHQMYFIHQRLGLLNHAEVCPSAYDVRGASRLWQHR
jgi:hypothetical protein